MTDPADQVVNMNFRMTEGDRRAFKAWCAGEGLTLTEGFHEGVALLKGVRAILGAAEAESLVETIACASVYVIDAERDLRVERRDGDAWVVCEGKHRVVTRDGDLEHADEAYVDRTRFGLQEALRIARRRAEDAG